MKAKIVLTDRGRNQFGPIEWVALATWSLREGWEPFNVAATVVPAPEVREENCRVLDRESWAGVDQYTLYISDSTFEAVRAWLEKVDKAGFWDPARD